MNLFHLRYFVTLANTEHYGRAAEMLSITQPSLSYAISSLEEELGIRLFEKHGRNIALTKYGKAFLDEVTEVLAKLDNSIRDMKLAANGEGEINIGFLRTLGTDFVPQMVRSFKDLHPLKEIDFRLFCDYGLSVDILDGLIRRQIDVAFCSRIENHPEIEFIPVAMQELVVLVPDGHPLAHKEFVTLEETMKYKQIIFRKKSGLRHIIDQVFASIGQYPEVTYELAEDQVAAGFVAQGFGIMIAPVFASLDAIPVKRIPLKHPMNYRYFYMAILKDSYRPPLVEEFKDFVIEKSKDNMTYTYG